MRKALFMMFAIMLMAGCPWGNRAPDTPSIPSGPFRAQKDSLTRFSSSAADPDDDSVCIRFDWGDGDTSNWSQYAASGESVSMSYAWSDSGKHTVRAQAKDQEGLASVWSPGCLVGVGDYLVLDGFECYDDDEYPGLGGWYELWSGIDAYVTSAAAHAGSKSFRLTGDPNWVRADGIRLDMGGVGSLVYEFSVMVPSGSANGALAGFFQRVSGNESRDYNAVGFDGEKMRVAVKGVAWTETDFTWQKDRWYSVRVELDYASALMSAWVNDTLVASGLTAADPSVSDVFELSTEWRPNSGTVVAYFDDIAVLAP